MAFNQMKTKLRSGNVIFVHNQARYAFNQGLAGLMIWSIDSDDFLPECSNRRYPLLRAINSEFNDKQGDKKRLPDVVDHFDRYMLIICDFKIRNEYKKGRGT